jgi:hypothetical protein
MSHKLPLILALLAITLLSAAFAVPAPRAVADDDTQLAQYMDDINKGMRSLRKLLADPESNPQSIEIVRQLQLLGVKAKGEQPALLADIPEADQAAFLTAYAKAMCALVGGFVELEVALLDGDNERAKELRSELNKLKKPGHRDFKKPDEDEEDHGGDRGHGDDAGQQGQSEAGR